MKLAFVAIAFLFSLKSIAQVPVTSFKCSGNPSYPVSLSFDDGPLLPNTEKILDILKKENIKATFFISSDKFPGLLNGHPSPYEKKLMALIRRMKAEGHTVGSHSFHHIEHANLTTHSADQIATNLENNDRVLKNLGLKPPMPFRFPYGSGWFDESKPANETQALHVNAKVRSEGFQLTHWDIDSFDWSAIKRKALPTSVLKQICTHQGGIILMHDIQRSTVLNLPSIIESIRKSGHKFASLAELRAINTTRPDETKFTSLADHAAGIFSCHRPVSDFDQVFPTCAIYEKKSADIHPPEKSQTFQNDGAEQ